MAQVIHTNLSSLSAQNALNRSQGMLSKALERLSSGLRINHAGDDAAGLAISTRFSSQIRGLAQAQRNANDAISLTQVGEAGLNEITNILQRIRELSVQSANGTNSAADRSALQNEVNELKSELNRIASTTEFNGLKVLNGDLASAVFQVGAEANQTITVSISDVRNTAIGSHQLQSSNEIGIERASYQKFINAGVSTNSLGTYAAQGASASAKVNAYTAVNQDLILVSTASDGSTTNTTIDAVTNLSLAAGDTAYEVATAINTYATANSLTSAITATAFNSITVSSYTAVDGTGTLKFFYNGTGGGAGTEITLTTATSLSEIATLINVSASLSANVFADYDATASAITVYSTTGVDLGFVMTAGTGTAGRLTVDSAITGSTASAINMVQGTTNNATFNGKVDVKLGRGYSLQSTTNADGMFYNSGGTATTIGSDTIGETDVTGGNFVGAQTLTIAGPSGTSTVAVTANQTAEDIAASVNLKTATTGVAASARTQVKLKTLSNAGTVTFNLYGDNTTAQSVSASISSTSNLSALITAINNVKGTTGITATVGEDSSEIILTHEAGKDIKIENFTHSTANTLDASDVTAGTNGSGASDNAVRSIVVIGNPSTNSTSNTTTLYDGGNILDSYDSTVVGGEVVFSSSTGSFTVKSSISQELSTAGASLFATSENVTSQSALSTIGDIDISTFTDANNAIKVVDGALDMVNAVRSTIGASQNRFEFTVSALAGAVENLSAARSRIIDADFAAETANLTKAQILQQAGIAVLSQANSLPQNILALLQQ